MIVKPRELSLPPKCTLFMIDGIICSLRVFFSIEVKQLLDGGDVDAVPGGWGRIL